MQRRLLLSFSQRKDLPGSGAHACDLMLQADGGDCMNNVVHVGIPMRAGWMPDAGHAQHAGKETDDLGEQFAERTFVLMLCGSGEVAWRT